MGNKVDKELIIKLKNDIFRALLEADIQLDMATQMAENLHKRALSESPPPGTTRQNAIISIVYDELTGIMGGNHYPLNIEKGKTNILMLARTILSQF